LFETEVKAVRNVREILKGFAVRVLMSDNSRSARCVKVMIRAMARVQQVTATMESYNLLLGIR